MTWEDYFHIKPGRRSLICLPVFKAYRLGLTTYQVTMVKFDEDDDSNGSLILPALLGLVLFILAQVYRRRQLIASLNLPPCYSGWIPFLGCAVEFGKEPLNFIEKMHQQVNLFTRGVDNFMTIKSMC